VCVCVSVSVCLSVCLLLLSVLGVFCVCVCSVCVCVCLFVCSFVCSYLSLVSVCVCVSGCVNLLLSVGRRVSLRDLSLAGAQLVLAREEDSFGSQPQVVRGATGSCGHLQLSFDRLRIGVVGTVQIGTGVHVLQAHLGLLYPERTLEGEQPVVACVALSIASEAAHLLVASDRRRVLM
jgi:hypothetical protein